MGHLQTAVTMSCFRRPPPFTSMPVTLGIPEYCCGPPVPPALAPFTTLLVLLSTNNFLCPMRVFFKASGSPKPAAGQSRIEVYSHAASSQRSAVLPLNSTVLPSQKVLMQKVELLYGCNFQPPSNPRPMPHARRLLERNEVSETKGHRLKQACLYPMVDSTRNPLWNTRKIYGREGSQYWHVHTLCTCYNCSKILDSLGGWGSESQRA